MSARIPIYLTPFPFPKLAKGGDEERTRRKKRRARKQQKCGTRIMSGKAKKVNKDLPKSPPFFPPLLSLKFLYHAARRESVLDIKRIFGGGGMDIFRESYFFLVD